MKEVTTDELNKITGGTDISASIINAFVNVIKLLIDAGENVGSSIRRVATNNICPLK